MKAFRSSPFPSPRPLAVACSLQAFILFCCGVAATARGDNERTEAKRASTNNVRAFRIRISFREGREGPSTIANSQSGVCMRGAGLKKKNLEMMNSIGATSLTSPPTSVKMPLP